MLIQFNVGNVLSFNKTVSFSMVGANPVKEFENINSFIDPTHKFKLLKTASIYGANASGKSNLIKAMSSMKNLVLNSFRDALLDKKERLINVQKFMLNTECDKKPSFFEILFIQKKKRYRYGFEVSNGIIISEWLFFVKTTREIELFVREGNSIKIHKNSFKEGVGLEGKTLANVLFLTVVAQLNGEKSSTVIDWFKKFKILSGLNKLHHNITLSEYKNNAKFKKWAQSIFTSLDIIDFNSVKATPQVIDIKVAEKEKNQKIHKLFSAINELQKDQGDAEQVLTWHNKYDGNKILKEQIPFDFYSQESEGTKKIINYLGPIYDTLSKGFVLVVDELDSRLHPLLTIMIINFFHEHNVNNAQLIFASHDTNLLKKDYFRRDQIWFTEKNDFKETELYSLIEYNEEHVRNDASFDKNYLKGRYGAIPFLDNILTEFN